MANKFADKELRQRMKAAKKEKKRMKYEALLRTIQQVNENDRAYHIRSKLNPIERELYLKQRELAEEITIYEQWVRQQQEIEIKKQEAYGGPNGEMPAQY